MRPRPFSRRFLAALLSVFLLQLTLLGSGTLCGMRGARSLSASAMKGSMHDGMQHAVTTALPSAAAASPALTPVSTDGCDTFGDTSTCGNPWSTGSCTSMANCAVAVTTSASLVLDLWVNVHVRQIAEPLSAPLGPSFAPELPPPRA